LQRIVFRDNAAILERMEGRQIIVKEEIEQEIKDQPVVGSFASREKSLARATDSLPASTVRCLAPDSAEEP